MENGDILISRNEIQMVNGNELLRQTVESVLQTNKREWFLNWEEGINFYNILGKRRSDEIIKNEIAKGLLQVDSSFVIEEFNISVNGREMQIAFTAKNSNGDVISVSNFDGGTPSVGSPSSFGYRYSSANYGNLSQKANKATTLAGYGITDAYTKEQTEAYIEAALANSTFLTRRVVEALPDLSQASSYTIYVIPENNINERDKYGEYMVINGAWEKTGGTSETDLSDYMKTDDSITADEIDSLYEEV